MSTSYNKKNTKQHNVPKHTINHNHRGRQCASPMYIVNKKYRGGKKNVLEVARGLLDIGIVTFLLYKTFMLVRGTRAVEILKGVTFLLVLWVLSSVLELETLKFILTQLLVYGLLGIIVIFQPELRGALERLGGRGLFKRSKGEEDTNYITPLLTALEGLAKENTGALVVIEREDSLDEYTETGIEVDAKTTTELVQNIFAPNVPLHDGAVIMRKGRILSASCILPLTSRGDLSNELGTRHRAAIGISEKTDAIAVVVSEETGRLSYAIEGVLERGVTKTELDKVLSAVHEEQLITGKDKTMKNRGIRTKRNNRKKQNGKTTRTGGNGK